MSYEHEYHPSTQDGLPTLLLLHGTGGDEHSLLPFARQFAPGAALLSLRGKVLENGRARFFRRFSERDFDLDDLRFRTDELVAFLRERMPTAPLVAVGYSVGANIAAHMMLRYPGVLNGAVLLRGMTPYEYADLPNLHGTHVLISNGRHDPIAIPAETERLYTRLQSCDADVVLHWNEGGHDITDDDAAAAQKWFAAKWRV